MRNLIILLCLIVQIFVISACGDGTAVQSSATSAPSPTPSAEITDQINTNVPQNAAVNPTPAANGVNACDLIQKTDFEKIQADTLKDAKPSYQTEGALTHSQCFYLAGTFANSISLTVSKGVDGSRTAKDWFEEKFNKKEEEERGPGGKGKSENEKEHRQKPKSDSEEAREKEAEGEPLRIKGIGEEAFWAGDARVGALYVLKKDVVLRISVGGGTDQAVKMKKSKAIAKLVLSKF